MNRLICAGALVFGGLAASGCATVNVGATAGSVAASFEETSASGAQQELRAASSAFVVQAEEAGWSDADGMGRAARRTLDTLIHGRDAAAEAESVSRSALYLEARSLDGAAGAAVRDALVADIGAARRGVRAINALAGAVAAGPERASWSRREDVRAVEDVVRAARQSYALFTDVAADAEPRLDSDGVAAVRRELAAFDLELDRLSVAADALSLPAADREAVAAAETSRLAAGG